MSETLRDRRLRYARAMLQTRSTSQALLGESSDLDALRVLVLGVKPQESLCALMHTECQSAEARLPDASVAVGSADLVLAPHVASTEIGAVVNQAARALDNHGRVVIAIPNHEPNFINEAFLALVKAGFDAPILQQAGTQTCIHACRGHVFAFGH